MLNSNGAFQIVPGKNNEGDHVFSVVVKRTFSITPEGAVERLIPDRELRKIDAYYNDDDPQSATLQYEYELAATKQKVDVAVIGKAYAPYGEPTRQMTVSVQVGERRKDIAVIGDRRCQYRPDMPPLFSDPAPFKEMEIRYERAYGGRDEKSLKDIPFTYPRNDMGVGIVLKNTKETVQDLALPNLEDPDDLLTPERLIIEEPENWHKQPLPQGLGWFQRTWYPRSAFVGVYPPFLDVDVVTTEERLGILPENHIALAKQFKLPSYSSKINNGASHGMMFSGIREGEKVTLCGLTASGFLEFTLPTETPYVSLELGSGPQMLTAKLDTVTIRPDDLELDLIWRSPCPYEGYSWLPQMKKLVAEVR
jgi:hypothetical protein